MKYYTIKYFESNVKIIEFDNDAQFGNIISKDLKELKDFSDADILVSGGLFSQSDKGYVPVGYAYDGNIQYQTYQSGTGLPKLLMLESGLVLTDSPKYDNANILWGREGKTFLLMHGEIDMRVNPNHANEIKNKDSRCAVAFNETTRFIVQPVKKGDSKGLTSQELAVFCKEILNCKYAIEFDGGGTTQSYDNETKEYIVESSDPTPRKSTDCFYINEKESEKMNNLKLLYEFKEDYDGKPVRFLNGKPGMKIFLQEISKFVKPQYTSNLIKFTQLSHEDGAYDFGDDNIGDDPIYMPFDGTVLYEGYDTPFYNTGAICVFVESEKEIAKGKKAIIWIWHLANTLINTNDYLKRRHRIGNEGNTGVSFGSHSHVGMAIVPINYKFNADLNTFKHLKSKYVVDLVDNVYVYPHQKVLDSPILKDVKDRIKYI